MATSPFSHHHDSYQYLISHDEMFPNIYKIQETTDRLWLEVEGKKVSSTEGDTDDSLIGGNATAEGPEDKRCLDGAASWPAAAMKPSSPSQVPQNYHQDAEAATHRQSNLELHRSSIYLAESLRTEKLTELQNQRGGHIFLQDIKKPDFDDWESRLNAVECALHLEKSVHQSLLELHKLATDENDPHLCDFVELHYLDKQVKLIKQLGDHVTNLPKMGLPQVQHGRASL
ncbi:Ferritin heavy chain [Fukomys damarensis]|uniref:Ferritin n=1 Tax=Fukomys damarensis TaxID=885580 RepID=A0A091DRU7_FUKDA|nr:Ferritin heavy chain [Fukomys damarensis]